MAFKSGRSIKGYEIIERISSGGLGAVYRAFQTTLGREVAVKVILPGLASQPDFIRRFEIEAQIIARLEHLHIVPLYDFWRDLDGAFLVMRWMRGGSVKELLAKEPYSVGSASRLLDQVASALSTAHAANVVHRDIKPSNILLDEEGNAYLADFNIAKDLNQNDDQPTWSEAVVGSPDYLSPEQARSEPVTAQTDIYGLGVTLYEILTGHLPFPELSGVERLFKHINEPIPAIENLDPLIREAVNEVIQKATAKNPRNRYEDVLQMSADFRQAARIEEDPHSELVESLTIREQEILQLIMQGNTNREIADALFIEVSTVKWNIRQIYPKLGVRNRRQAIMRARELNLLIDGGQSKNIEDSPTDDRPLLPLPINPYKGLRPFNTADSKDYFGREHLIRKMLVHLTSPEAANGQTKRSGRPANREMVGRDRFLAVVGPSGIGKSSLVQAGLIPALSRGEVPGSDRWFIVQMTPGTHPLDELEVALLRIAANQGGNLREQLQRDENGLLRTAKIILPKDGSDLVLVIDQFEELFTLTTDENDRKHFIDNLVAAVSQPGSRVRLVLTLRADYFDRPLHYAQFGDLVRSHMVTVLPLSAEELERAIIQPAQQAGITLEPGLAARIIDDVLYQPGGLPLLQYTLTELFEHRDERTLTLSTYETIGGATGALARRAEELFQEQDEVGQEAIRQLFLRLVVLNSGQESALDTRRRVPRAELTAVAAEEFSIDEIIDSYASYRLLTLDHDPASRRPTVEVAHEALLREWERLRAWLEHSRDDLYQHRRLQVLAQDWLTHDRDPGLLLHQTRLDQFAAWAVNSDIVLTPGEQDFLDSSLAARQDRRSEEEVRRQRELETAQQLAETEQRRAAAQAEAAQRLRRRALYLGVALAVAGLLAVWAIFTSRQAVQNAQQAQNNANIASTQEALAAAEAASAAAAEAAAEEERQIAEDERDNAQTAAQAALDAQSTAEAEAVQRAAAEAVAIDEREEAQAQQRLASARELSLAAINNLDIDPQLSVLLAMQAVQTTLNTDSMALPEAQSALHVALTNLQVEKVFSSSSPETCNWCADVQYAAEGGMIAGSGPGNTAVLWDAGSGEEIATVEGHSEPVVAVALNSDSSRLATASEDDTAVVWQLSALGPSSITVEALLTLSGHTNDLTSVVFSPDGAQIATASRDETIKLWDAASGEELAALVGHEGSVRDVLFHPDDNLLISGSNDGTVKIWDVATGQELRTLDSHTDRVSDLALSSDGSRLATVSWDGTMKVWDVASWEELISVPADEARAYAVAISPDGSLIAAAGTDAVIDIWDVQSGEEVLSLPGHQAIIYNLAFSPDGQRLASGAGDGTIQTWDISRSAAHEWLTLDGHNWVMFGVDFSPDGRMLATASWDGALKVWDADTGEELKTLLQDESRKMSVQFSPDGRMLAATAENDAAVLWDTSSWQVLHTLQGYEGPVLDSAFSPDGSLLVTVGENGPQPGLINVWNTESGELERSWVGHDANIERVAVDPKSRFIATGSIDGLVKIWDLAAGVLINEIPAHAGPVNGVNFSHDGTLLATGGGDNLAKIWQISGTEFAEKAVLQGHNSVVWDAVFSPDDTLLATISFDSSVKLWDVNTGVEFLTLSGNNNGREVSFSPDGKLLAVTASPGLVPIYVIPVEELLPLAQARVQRGFTEAECRQYLHSDRCPPAP